MPPSADVNLHPKFCTLQRTLPCVLNKTGKATLDIRHNDLFCRVVVVLLQDLTRVESQHRELTARMRRRAVVRQRLREAQAVARHLEVMPQTDEQDPTSALSFIHGVTTQLAALRKALEQGQASVRADAATPDQDHAVVTAVACTATVPCSLKMEQRQDLSASPSSATPATPVPTSTRSSWYRLHDPLLYHNGLVGRKSRRD